MPRNTKSLKTKTERGGFRHDIATSWNSKLTRKRRKCQLADVPAEVLYREIRDAYHKFWARRRVLPPL